MPSIATQSHLYRHESYQLSQWQSWRPTRREDGDVQLFTLLNNLTVISVSCFHHVQDRRQRMGSNGHLLQSSRECIHMQIRLKIWVFFPVVCRCSALKKFSTRHSQVCSTISNLCSPSPMATLNETILLLSSSFTFSGAGFHIRVCNTRTGQLVG